MIRLSMLLQEARMGTTQPRSLQTLTTILREELRGCRGLRRLCLNLTTPTLALSNLAMTPFAPSEAQWRIGTGREPEGN